VTARLYLEWTLQKIDIAKSNRYPAEHPNMRLRTTDRTEPPAPYRPDHKVVIDGPLPSRLKLPSLRNLNPLPEMIALIRRIPKRALVATLFVAVYRAMCGYQMSYIAPGIFVWITQGSPNWWAIAFPEFGAVTGWFKPPDTSVLPHAAFAALVFFDTLAFTVLCWWFALKLPVLIRRKSPWRGRNFRH